jgi:hypothetical protein
VFFKRKAAVLRSTLSENLIIIKEIKRAYALIVRCIKFSWKGGKDREVVFILL